MRHMCTKIRHRLETIGVHCSSVDCSVKTGKRMTELLVSAPIPIPTDIGDYRPILDTQYRYRSNPSSCLVLLFIITYDMVCYSHRDRELTAQELSRCRNWMRVWQLRSLIRQRADQRELHTSLLNYHLAFLLHCSRYFSHKYFIEAK